MQEMKPGARVVYCAEGGGFNGVVTKVFNDPNESVSLVWVDDKGNYHVVEKVPNVYFAIEDITRVHLVNIETSIGRPARIVEKKIKGPGLKRYGYWRR